MSADRISVKTLRLSTKISFSQYHSQSSVRYKFYNFVDFICCFIMLERPGDLIPVTPQATSIPWTKRRSQILKFLHRGPVTFKTLVYDTNVGDISPLSAYFNPDRDFLPLMFAYLKGMRNFYEKFTTYFSLIPM